MMVHCFPPISGITHLTCHQSGADAIRVRRVVVTVVAVGVDVPDVVGVVGVRGAEPPVGGRYESYPNTRRVPPPNIPIEWDSAPHAEPER